MYRILIPIDENEERTLKQTDYVRRVPLDETEVEVMVLHVKEADHKGAPEQEFEDVSGATRAVEELEEAGFSCLHEQRGGPVAKNVLEAIDDFDADEVVMGGRKRSEMVEIVLGSVTREMIESADCTVTVV